MNPFQHPPKLRKVPRRHRAQWQTLYYLGGWGNHWGDRGISSSGPHPTPSDTKELLTVSPFLQGWPLTPPLINLGYRNAGKGAVVLTGANLRDLARPREKKKPEKKRRRQSRRLLHAISSTMRFQVLLYGSTDRVLYYIGGLPYYHFYFIIRYNISMSL